MYRCGSGWRDRVFSTVGVFSDLLTGAVTCGGMNTKTLQILNDHIAQKNRVNAFLYKSFLLKAYVRKYNCQLLADIQSESYDKIANWSFSEQTARLDAEHVRQLDVARSLRGPSAALTLAWRGEFAFAAKRG